MFLTRILTLAAIAFVCSALSSVAAAQYTAAKIIFKSPGPFTQKDLEAAAGMHPGSKAGNAEVKTAAQKLMDTGYFDDVGVYAQGPIAALNITYTLKPLEPSKLTPAGFENFIWLTPEELSSTIHAAAPLFHNTLPEAGNQIDAITSGLQAALNAKGVHATVVFDTLEPSADQSVRAIEFSVKEPAVRIHSITLQGVTPEIAAEETKAEQKLRGTNYNEGLRGTSTTSALLQPFFWQGFLAAHLSNVQRTIATSSPAEVDIDFSASVDPGEAYRLSALSFSGNTLIPSEELLKNATIHPGDIASSQKIGSLLEPIRLAYEHQGYIDAFAIPTYMLDATAHTVRCEIQVHPGEQFRLRSVTPLNLSGDALKDFNSRWRLKPGDLYDGVYVVDFLMHNLALGSLKGYSATFDQVSDPQTHQVDLTIKFVRAGAAR